MGFNDLEREKTQLTPSELVSVPTNHGFPTDCLVGLNLGSRWRKSFAMGRREGENCPTVASGNIAEVRDVQGHHIALINHDDNSMQLFIRHFSCPEELAKPVLPGKLGAKQRSLAAAAKRKAAVLGRASAGKGSQISG